MGRGGKDASLEVFETQLKKLLHIIDKLPKPDREKAVDILKISANHYSNLTVSQSLQDTVVMPVSQAYCTTLEQEQQYYTTAPSSFPSCPQAVAGASRLESESILAELGGLGEERQGVVAGLEEDWDQHVGRGPLLPHQQPHLRPLPQDVHPGRVREALPAGVVQGLSPGTL